ncbi:MAG: hypothetical protein K0B02_05055 [DPANN group archaeon]|nr:hypothetical protein [DPANN group archaeon]
MKKILMKHYDNLTNIDETSLSVLEKAMVQGFGFAIGAGVALVILFMLITMGVALV